MTMLEKIAQAIADSDGETVDGWDGLYQDRARAALEAMLEPSDGMIEAYYLDSADGGTISSGFVAAIRQALENEK